MEGILHVASPGNVQLADDIQRRRTQHLVFFVAQRLRRRYYDAVSRVHAYRIQILHIAHGDAVAVSVPHHFILDLLPAGNAPLDQDLPHAGQAKPILQNFHQLHSVLRNTAAAAAQRVGRTQDHRIADLFRELDACLHSFHHQGCRAGFPDLLHGSLEFQTVFRLLDGLGGGPDQTHIIAP